MYERLAGIFVNTLLIYAVLGFLFAIAFVSFGVQKIDPEARGTRLGFRLIILPGVTALWPLMLNRWLRGLVEPPTQRNPHR